jgi:hypothetical protein
MGRVANICRNVSHEHVVTVPAVLGDEQYDVGDLHKADLLQVNKRLQRRFQRAELPVVLAGVDISLNEDSAGAWDPHWQVQVYGVVVGLPRVEVKQRLILSFPPSNSVSRPLKVRKCDELQHALSYTIKPMFIRRVSYVDDTGRLNTRKVTLKVQQINLTESQSRSM